MDQEQLMNAVNPLFSKCQNASSTGILDLSHSQLTAIPEVVFNFMSNAGTEVKECDLSGNLMQEIHPKLAIDFKILTNLNIAHNLLMTLPKEIGNLRALERLNISCNYLFELPDVVFKLPNLTYLYAQDNLITEIDIEQPIESDNLALVDLRYNTLKPEFLRKLMKIQTTFRLVLNDAEVNDNDYEDYDDQDDDDDDDGFIKN
ncbi:leucine-rich repeat protein soc-2 homolog [Drosophila persimilis]|uniref:leucine-rich repeat protein soc-2 homolog n=1 Tax=Drosophila persimilis TaxID=7234 RepID=UPI000F08B1A3|nr:leucine-rich repeat protein soc-2 homolog [Drosophila persimilis]